MRVVGLLVGPVAHGPAPPRPQALQCVRELSLGTSELQLYSASLRWLQMRSRGVRRAKSALYLTSDQIPRHKARSFLPRYAVRRWSWITTLLVRLDRHQVFRLTRAAAAFYCSRHVTPSSCGTMRRQKVLGDQTRSLTPHRAAPVPASPSASRSSF
jgi:hypothetical protein